MCHARTIYSRVLHVKHKMYEKSKKFDFLGMVKIYYEGSYRGGRRKRPPLEGFGSFEGFISETPVKENGRITKFIIHRLLFDDIEIPMHGNYDVEAGKKILEELQTLARAY